MVSAGKGFAILMDLLGAAAFCSVIPVDVRDAGAAPADLPSTSVRRIDRAVDVGAPSGSMRSPHRLPLTTLGRPVGLHPSATPLAVDLVHSIVIQGLPRPSRRVATSAGGGWMAW